MAATRTKTGANGKPLPDGIFRQGDHYAVSYRINRRLRWEYARTEDDAVRAKAKHTIEARQAKAHAKGHHRGDPQDDCPDCQQELKARDRAAPTLHEYLIGDPDNGVKGWIERYGGTGRRGYRTEAASAPICAHTTRSGG